MCIFLMSHTCVIYKILQYTYGYTHRCMFKHSKSCTDTGTYRHTHTHSRTHTHTQTCRKPEHDYDFAKNDLIELIFDFHIYIYIRMYGQHYV